MLLLTVAAMVIAGVWAQGDPAAKPCCAPHQMTMTLGDVGMAVVAQGPYPIDTFQEMTYDYDAKKLYTAVHQRIAGSVNETVTRVLIDYGAHKQYTIVSDDTCYVEDHAEDMPAPCVPDNATFVGTVRFGGGANTMDTNVWDFEGPNDQRFKVVVTADASCTPVVYSMYGTDVFGMPGVSEQNLFYVNLKTTIADRSMLSLPTGLTCGPMPTDSPMDPSVGRRSLPFPN